MRFLLAALAVAPLCRIFPQHAWTAWLLPRNGAIWATLHRLVYAAAAASFAHWILVAFDRTTAYAYLAIGVALVVARVSVNCVGDRP